MALKFIKLAGLMVLAAVVLTGCQTTNKAKSYTYLSLEEKEAMAYGSKATKPEFFGFTIGEQLDKDSVTPASHKKTLTTDPYSGGFAYNKLNIGIGTEDSFIRVITNDDNEIIFIRLTAMYPSVKSTNVAFDETVKEMRKAYPGLSQPVGIFKRTEGYYTVKFITSERYLEGKEGFFAGLTNHKAVTFVNDFISKIDIVNGLVYDEGYNMVVTEIMTKEYEEMVDKKQAEKDSEE